MADIYHSLLVITVVILKKELIVYLRDIKQKDHSFRNGLF